MNNKAPSVIGRGLDVPKRLRDGVITRKKMSPTPIGGEFLIY